jgi:hypothetical protein
MSIPSNFIFLEQQILNVDNTGETAQFTVAPPAGESGDDCFVYNNSAGNPCQVLIGESAASATPVVDASANGTEQFKVDKGVGILIKLNGSRWIGAICESGKTTTLYCHRGTGQ